MNQRTSAFRGCIVMFLHDFFGQIISGAILLTALVAWLHFSTVYAAIPVVVVGLILWAGVGKLVQKKGKGPERD